MDKVELPYNFSSSSFITGLFLEGDPTSVLSRPTPGLNELNAEDVLRVSLPMPSNGRVRSTTPRNDFETRHSLSR